MPKVMTGKQRRFMGAQLGKKAAGQQGDIDMSAADIKKYMKKHAKKAK